MSALTAQKSPRTYALRRLIWVSLLVLCVGVVISLTLYQQLLEQNQQRTEQALAERLEQIALAVQENVTLYQYGLTGIRAAVMTVGPDKFDYQAMRSYSASRNYSKEFPGAHGFGVVRLIAPQQKEQFIRQASAERDTPFTIRQLTPHTGSAFVIQYIEPEQPNKEAIGLDIGSEAMRRKTALAAAANHQVQLSAPLTLVQATEHDQQGFLMLAPIYRTLPVPPSIEERMQAMYGWAYAPILIAEVLTNVPGIADDIAITLADITENSNTIFFELNQIDTDYPVSDRQLELFGRTWQIVLAARPAFISALQLPAASNLLYLSLAITVLLCAVAVFFQLSVSRRLQLSEQKSELASTLQQANIDLEHQVEQRTAEIAKVSALQRSIFNGAGYAIITTDINGVITLCNPAAEQILRYKAADLVGKHTPEIFHIPEEVAARAAELSSELGETVPAGFETFVARAKRGLPDVNEWTYKRKDGSFCPVRLSVGALTDDHGELMGFVGIAYDLTERKQLEFELELTRVSTEHAPDLMFWLTADAGIIKVNPAVSKALGYSNKQLLQHSLLRLDKRLNLQQWQQIIERLTQQQELRFDTLYRHADGHDIPVATTVSLVEFSGQQYIYLVARDITRQLQREQELADAKDIADAASIAKSSFLANMSHEIRTPMNAILGLLQLVRHTELNSRQLDYIDKAQRASHSLLEILNDILDFSKVEAGKLELDEHEFCLSVLMQDIGVILSNSLQQKDLEVLYRIDENVPEYLVGDSLRLKQILLNLAGNAVKFTEKGEVLISVCRTEAESPQVALVFSIKDTGIGMTAEQLDVIFSGFHQAESSISRRFGGTGLGLAISKSLVELMGGSISVTSKPEVGSEFTFSAILGEAQNQPSSQSMPLQAGPLQVLIVDDNANARLILHDMATQLGWQADIAASGQGALKMVEAANRAGKPYQLVFLDWKMPGMNGLDVAQALRSSTDAQLPPLIVMITAYGREMLEHHKDTYQQLLNGFLIKPITQAMMYNAVAEILQGPARSATTATPVVSSGRPLTGLNLLLVEDNVTNQLVATELLQSQGAIVHCAISGLAALDLLQQSDVTFDAVLMDIQMPGMDGYQTTMRIRQQPAFIALPIIAMTANAMPSDVSSCLAAGMNDHVAKPFDLLELVSKILQHCGVPYTDADLAATRLASEHMATSSAFRTTRSNSSGQSAMAKQPVSVTDSDKIMQFADAHQLALPAALQRLGQSLPLYHKALQQFIRDLQQSFQQLSEPELTPEQARLVAHTLKSAAAITGFSSLSTLSADTEQQLKLQDAELPLAQVAALTQTIEHSISVAVKLEQLLAERFNQLPVKATPLPPAELTRQLTQLQELLVTSNMAALPLFHSLQVTLQKHNAALAAKLDEAINQLDFEQAAQLLTQLR